MRVKPLPPTPKVSESREFPSFAEGDVPPTDNMGRGRVTVKKVAYCDKPENAKAIAFTRYYSTWSTESKEVSQWVFLWMEHYLYTRSVETIWRQYLYCDNSFTDWEKYSVNYGSWHRQERTGLDILGFIPVEQGGSASFGVSMGSGDGKPHFTFSYERKDGEGGFSFDSGHKPTPDPGGLVQDAIDSYRRTGSFTKDSQLGGGDIRANQDILNTELKLDMSSLRTQPSISDLSLDHTSASLDAGAVHTVTRPMLANETKDKFIPYFNRNGQQVGIEVGSILEWDDIPDDFRGYMSTQNSDSTFEVVSIEFTDRNDLPAKDTVYIYGVQAIVALQEKQRVNVVN